MSKKPLKKGKGRTERLEIRLSSDLKRALDLYSEQNLESVMETVNQAIKHYVGFGQDNPKMPPLCDDDLPKTDRLEIRVHPLLRKMILDICNKNDGKDDSKSIKISKVVISAIIQYIGYNQRNRNNKV